MWLIRAHLETETVDSICVAMIYNFSLEPDLYFLNHDKANNKVENMPYTKIHVHIPTSLHFFLSKNGGRSRCWMTEWYSSQKTLHNLTPRFGRARDGLLSPVSESLLTQSSSVPDGTWSFLKSLHLSVHRIPSSLLYTTLENEVKRTMPSVAHNLRFRKSGYTC